MKSIFINSILGLSLILGFTSCSIEEDDGDINTTTNIGDITHNEITYGTVTSPYTGKIWLDKNLGAAQVCTSFDDAACYGDYYQWGRNTDGHENSNSTTTSTQATNIYNAGTNFILSSNTFDYDWAKNADANGTQRSLNWSNTGGSSVCPDEFRVPTMLELIAETIDLTGNDDVQNRDDAFNNFLKLPSAGARGNDAGDMDSQASYGYVWSNTNDGSNSWYLYFGANSANEHNSHRSSGFSVRCIKDETTALNVAPVADSGSDQTIMEGVLVFLSASGSYDSDGTINSYLWQDGTSTLSTNMDFSKSDFSVGTHTITLTVTDNNGVTSSDTVIIIINSDTPSEYVHNIAEGTITSPTGQVWMDRNLGASQVCTSLDDVQCYGGYYQWGRDADGHEQSNSLEVSGPITTLIAGHPDFITVSISDWTTADNDGSIRHASWNPCPGGFAVPTIAQLEAENIQDRDDAYNNFKLPSAGYRHPLGSLYNVGSAGWLWSSSLGSYDGVSKYLLLYPSTTGADQQNYPYGFSVRCIKE